jgi:hypothetical protein
MSAIISSVLFLCILCIGVSGARVVAQEEPWHNQEFISVGFSSVGQLSAITVRKSA